ncbi:MAG TPA: phospholipase D family protein [Chthoniobacterales bacterium]|nr:phospholipase D family protein [Chthoniobacterales bacterium]
MALFRKKGSALLLLAAIILLALGWLKWCNRLPSLTSRATSTVVLDTSSTALGRSISPQVEAHPGLSGIYPLRDARDAFATRVHLARQAERTLDVQYYIWRSDMTSTLLTRALCDAADRGVRVRLLLDDNNTFGLDEILAALDSHPNIEVRLFNPFVIRTPRVGYLTDFFRANRRMHNKSFTADNQATIIGGRNVGDEYFGAAEEGLLFVDLDVLAIGPVVTDVSHDFDRYWESASSYPAARILPAVNSVEIDKVKAAASRVEQDPSAITYMTALRDTPFVRHLANRTLEMDWAVTHMISDDPAKGLGQASAEKLFPRRLKGVIGEPASHVEMVMAYFVPTAAGVNSLVSMAKRGVKIRIVTNSLEATDGPYVYAGYAKRRKALLEAGIELYELRRLSPHLKGDKGSGSAPGSSGSSLHAKTFAIDGKRIFVGSYNFDPRSAKLNTELGFVIDSPELADGISKTFETIIPERAYKIHLSTDGKIYWIERTANGDICYDKEPNTSFWLRAAVWLMSKLPIEWLL